MFLFILEVAFGFHNYQPLINLSSINLFNCLLICLCLNCLLLITCQCTRSTMKKSESSIFFFWFVVVSHISGTAFCGQKMVIQSKQKMGISYLFSKIMWCRNVTQFQLAYKLKRKTKKKCKLLSTTSVEIYE